jgi:hypothetical protein
MGPGVASIGGLVDSVAEGDAVAHIGFTGSNIDDVGIARLQGEIADRGDRLVVEYGFPGGSTICGFPDASGGAADINKIGVSWDSLDIAHTSHHIGGTDVPPFKVIEEERGYLKPAILVPFGYGFAKIRITAEGNEKNSDNNTYRISPAHTHKYLPIS